MFSLAAAARLVTGERPATIAMTMALGIAWNGVWRRVATPPVTPLVEDAHITDLSEDGAIASVDSPWAERHAA